jgi:hypothetical protein
MYADPRGTRAEHYAICEIDARVGGAWRIVKSEPFFHNGAKALAAMLSHAQYRSLEGRNHAAVLMAPQALADAAGECFLDGS